MKRRAFNARHGGLSETRVSGRIRNFLTGLLAGFSGLNAVGGPHGMQVHQGNVSAAQNGSRLDITASHNAVINWQSFNIGAGESVNFHQPNAVSVVWNRILDANPSQIWGSLSGNGIVVLMNQNGFFFGPNSSILVGGGFIATTMPIAPTSPIGGGMWQFSGIPPLASIVNYGEIKASSGGSIFLVAEKIENHGVLEAPDGTLGLYTGKELLLSERPDGRGLSASVRLPEGSIDNTGKLIADGGTIALHAQVVNNNGLVQANSVREHNGVIEFVASEKVELGAHSILQARGDAGGVSAGGSISIQSAHTFADQTGSKIDVTGGAEGGNGGSLELSAPFMSSLHSQLDGRAAHGWVGGQLFFDPTDITLTSALDASGDPSGTINSGDLPGESLRLNVDSAFANFAQIHLQATRDITLEQGTVWNLNDSTGISDPGSMLTLEAGNNITFGDSSRIVGGAGWSMRLAAGVDFHSPLLASTPGVGNIYFNGGAQDVNGAKPNGTGAIETSDGSISLAAGHDIMVGGGFVRTIGGGNIGITTGDGDVDAGTKNDTYDFFARSGYQVTSRGLGGIGTAAGGGVSIDAGRDILAFTAFIGAFGPFGNASASGDVNLTAGRDIKGHFMLRNGEGTLHAGRDAGSASSPISLGLTAGGWNVSALQDIFINEVYNPNGSQNSGRVRNIAYLFDYAPDAFANFNAGNSVHLVGNEPIHDSNSGNPDRPVIYAPRLDITAGAGGVELGNDVILAPSPLGSLSIHTTDGGSLRSAPGGFYQLVLSDSGSPRYTDFAAGHAATPLHLNRTDTAMRLDISGDIENLFIRSASRADIVVRGNAKNFSFEGQNLSPDDGMDNQLPLSLLADQITGLESIVARLNTARIARLNHQSLDSLSAYLLDQLSSTTLVNLKKYQDAIDSGGSPADQMALLEALRNPLVQDLNRLLAGSFYSPNDPTRFAGLSLRPETLALLGQVMSNQPVDQPGLRRLLLNRLLLEDVFPTEVVKRDDPASAGRRPFDDPADNNPNGNYSGIWIHGDLTSRSDRTFATLDMDPHLLTTIFNPVNTLNPELAARIRWVNGRLEIQGIMTATDVAFLMAPQVYRIDQVTQDLARDAHGNLIIDSAAPIFSSAVINDLFARSQDIPTSPLARNGLQIGGPGSFEIAAHNMDLGISAGIRSVGVQLNHSLASISYLGASLKLDLAGNLDMASSQIASFSGGSIDVAAAGKMDVGSTEQFTSDDTPKGVYTGHGGHVNVQADGDIDINGSRIATYDGGDISVTSDHGTIDAGSGGKGFFNVTTTQLDLLTGMPVDRNDKFFGSGIVALTRVDGEAKVGDIVVSAGMMNPLAHHTPKDSTDVEVTGVGDIKADAGGVLQLAFNKVDQSNAKVALIANGSIEAKKSGILGGNLDLQAGEGIEGLVVAQRDLNIAAQQNVTVTALAGGVASVTGGGNVSGSIVGGGGAAVTGGGEVSASVISAGGSGGSGNAFASVAAPVAQQTTTESEKKAVTATDTEDEEEKKRRAAAKAPVLAKTAGRVTVILPNK